ncbi:MAG: cyanophycin synthetase [Myxococcales bacterium]|nr:cyanophycin synthetase [Myxococcales bacterium]
MRLVDARRLTGPNHLARAPLVIVEIALDPSESADAALEAYRAELLRMRAAFGLVGDVTMLTRLHQGGAVFAYEAPVDTMLACAEMSEWAAESAAEVMASRPARSIEPNRAAIAEMLARDHNPRLVALAAEARRRDVPLLWDDDVVSLGTGKQSKTFPKADMPDVAGVAWDSLGSIPTVLVTGTNGKTTSSRLLARIATEAGLRVGTTSTDGITVGSELLEDGDWTGPAAARIVLRRADVDLAVLETARGGILRRGLAVDTCDAALITNVSDDHIGLYGIDDVDAMADVKGVVAKAVRPSGTAALNARDPRLVALASELACNVTFFADLEGPSGASAAAARAVIAEHRARGGRAVFTRAGDIVAARGNGASSEEVVARVDELPITFGGAARYNVENVLGAVAVAQALDLGSTAIHGGLRAFGMHDNPGRGQVVVRRGVTVLLDFGHNPEGVRAVMQLVGSLRKTGNTGVGASGQGRLTVVTGSPGDRSDQEIIDVARSLAEARPDRVFVRELGEYLRGRQPGDVPALYRRSFLELGLPADSFAVALSEVDALERAFQDAKPGDVIAVLVHLELAEVQAFLDRKT